MPARNMAEYQRARRAADPEYAERSRQQSLAAKRRRRGICELCGGETRYNGKTTNGPSRICGKCNAQLAHDARRWTKDTIRRAFRRFYEETGREPRVADSQGPCDSVAIGLSGYRIRELEQVQELGLVLPGPAAVRREFGSWAAALESCGMRVSRGGTPERRRSWV